MTHDQLQWALYGFCAGVFVCGVISDLLVLAQWWRARA
jgi:hypothetical protein